MKTVFLITALFSLVIECVAASPDDFIAMDRQQRDAKIENLKGNVSEIMSAITSSANSPTGDSLEKLSKTLNRLLFLSGYFDSPPSVRQAYIKKTFTEKEISKIRNVLQEALSSSSCECRYWAVEILCERLADEDSVALLKNIRVEGWPGEEKRTMLTNDEHLKMVIALSSMGIRVSSPDAESFLLDPSIEAEAKTSLILACSIGQLTVQEPAFSSILHGNNLYDIYYILRNATNLEQSSLRELIVLQSKILSGYYSKDTDKPLTNQILFKSSKLLAKGLKDKQLQSNQDMKTMRENVKTALQDPKKCLGPFVAVLLPYVIHSGDLALLQPLVESADPLVKLYAIRSIQNLSESEQQQLYPVLQNIIGDEKGDAIVKHISYSILSKIQH